MAVRCMTIHGGVGRCGALPMYVRQQTTRPDVLYIPTAYSSATKSNKTRSFHHLNGAERHEKVLRAPPAELAALVARELQ